MLPNLVLALIVFFVFLFAARWLKLLVKRLTRRHRQARNLGMVLGRLSQGIVILVGLFVSIVIPTFKAEIWFNCWASAVWQLVSPSAISSKLSSLILILLSRSTPRIVSSGRTVENIQTRATTIRTYDGRRIVIPNSELFTNSVTVNTAKPPPGYDVGIGYGDDLKQLMEAIHSVNGVLKDPAPDVLVVELAESSVNIRARWWINPPRRADALDGQSHLCD